jgi:hypothetical protein
MIVLWCMEAMHNHMHCHVMVSGCFVDQDAILTAHVREHGEGCWAEVASRLGGRTGIQCLQRWTVVLNPDIKRGAWSSEEVSDE